MKTLEERFWSKVNKAGPTQPHMSTPCWTWTAGLFRPGGYGQFAISHTEHEGAHRMAWRFLRGEIPSGLQVCHRCDLPACCNIDHLFLGTTQENTADRDAKSRQADRRGERHGMAKMTSASVMELRRAYAAGGETHSTLAPRFGISRANVGLIVSGAAWKHLPVLTRDNI